MNHTPGPWTYDYDKSKESVPQMKFFVGANGQGFAHTVGLNVEEDFANARLIAAAPELLEACKEVLNEMRAWNGEEEHYEEGIMFPMFQQLKAVIAKAEGNQ